MRTARRVLLVVVAILAELAVPMKVPGANAELSPRSSCPSPAPAGVPVDTSQLLLVTAASAHSTSGRLELVARGGDCWRRTLGPFDAVLGRNGLSAARHEGDGTTPLGTFAIGALVYGIAANPGLALAYRQLHCGDWWDEDPRSARYNQFVEVRCGTPPPFGGDSEALWRAAPAYDYLAVIEFNADPVRAGEGSGIFLHLADGPVTDGCVALNRAPLLAVLRALRPGAHPMVRIALTSSLLEASVRRSAAVT